MVDPATPRFLISCPGVFCVHSAIEWVHWPRRYRTSRWRCVGWCRRWRGRWCGRWSGERSWWKRYWWLWQSRGRSRRGTTPAHGAAAEILLGLGPCCFPHRESIITIVRERGGHSRQQPSQQREQQQQAQTTTTCDDAGEISSWSNSVKIASSPYVPVCGFLYVVSLASSHV